MKQRILISNDDGINAIGLAALVEVAKEFGDLTIVAPEAAMSGMSHAITMNTPLYLRKIEESAGMQAYACHGTPVDCIKIALDHIMEEKPTLVLSGINHGSNSNISVIYSGTLGAATEGAMNNIPSIGFSLLSHAIDADFSACKEVVRTVIAKVLSENNNPNLCLNVNIPNVPYSEIKGIKICRQTRGHWVENFKQHVNPRGMEYFWLTGDFHNIEPEAADSDEYALRDNYVSIVPVQTDLTDYSQLTTMQSWGSF